MRKVQEMSEVIHDDHTGMWEQMNPTQQRQWLTPLDLCMLQANSSNDDLHEYRVKNCSKYKAIGSASQKLFCNIGSSLGKQCFPPLATRTFFTQKLRDRAIGNTNSRYLNKVAKQLAYANKTLVFIGDGMSKQNQDALICEIMRTDRVTLLGSMHEEYRQLFHNFTIIWQYEVHGRPLKLDIIFLKMNQVMEPLSSDERAKLREEKERRKRARREKQLKRKGDRARRGTTNESVTFYDNLNNIKDDDVINDQEEEYDWEPIGRRLDNSTSSTNNETSLKKAEALQWVARREKEKAKARARASVSNSTSATKGKEKPVKSGPFTKEGLKSKTANAKDGNTKPVIDSPRPSIEEHQNQGSIPVTEIANALKAQAQGQNTSTSKLLISDEIKRGHAFSLDEVKIQTAHLEKLYAGMVVIANTGVWYNSRERFRTEVPSFLDWLNKIGKDPKNIVLYRETGAQHWNYSDSGYFESSWDQRQAMENGSCIPIYDSTPDHDWRNSDVINLLENLELEHVRVMPFRDITAPLFNMHPSHQSKQDCTHYCYFPQMWQSIWFDLNEAMSDFDLGGGSGSSSSNSKDKKEENIE